MSSLFFILGQHFHVTDVALALFIYFFIRFLRRRGCPGLIGLGWSLAWAWLQLLPALMMGRSVDLYRLITGVLLHNKNAQGTYVFNGPPFSNLTAVLTSDPRNLEHILKHNFINYPKGHHFTSTFQDLLGHGIFNVDGVKWREQRRIASVQLHSPSFRQKSADSLAMLVHSRLLPVLEEHSEPGGGRGCVDLQDVLLALTFDNVCIIVFGANPGSLGPGSPHVPFALAFEEALKASMQRFLTPSWVWKAMKLLNIGRERRLKESIKIVREFIDGVIETRRNEMIIDTNVVLKDSSGENRASSDMLAIFMDLKDAEGKPVFSGTLLRDICVSFLLGGRDGTAVALSWFFWLIDRNPNIEENILRELRSIVAERGEAATHTRPWVFTAEEVNKKMKYLHAALSEVLRLYPSIPMDQKEVIEDDILPDGTALKKGTKVVYVMYAMGRMKSIWGEDSRAFRPERWLQDGRCITEPAHKFAAFNAGPRQCLGKDLAYYQMKYVAASVLCRYKVKLAADHPVRPAASLVLYLRHGLKVNLYPRHI